MSEGTPPEDRIPRAAINKAGWRFATGASVIVALSLLAALLARVGLPTETSDSGSDALTTVTLVLAVLAFLIQIVVFVFQTHSSNSSVLRSEELNAQTRGVLDKIEANSSATQKVLFSQFDRLLDYVVDGKPQGAKPRERRLLGPASDVSHELEKDAPVKQGDVIKLVDEAVAQRSQRPVFPVGDAEKDEENAQLLRYLRSWPDRPAAEEAVARLVQLSPLGLATFVRFLSAEIIQRLDQEWVGLRVEDKIMDRATAELLEHGLLRRFEESIMRLTDEGRAAGRVLPFLKEDDPPEWLAEVHLPLLKAIEA